MKHGNYSRTSQGKIFLPSLAYGYRLTIIYQERILSEDNIYVMFCVDPSNEVLHISKDFYSLTTVHNRPVEKRPKND